MSKSNILKGLTPRESKYCGAILIATIGAISWVVGKIRALMEQAETARMF